MMQLAFQFHHQTTSSIHGISPLQEIAETFCQYRRRSNEGILEWAARKNTLRPLIVQSFMQAGGVIWGERRRCVWGNHQLFASLDGVTGGEVWRQDYQVPEFLPVLRWGESWMSEREWHMSETST